MTESKEVSAWEEGMGRTEGMDCQGAGWNFGDDRWFHKYICMSKLNKLCLYEVYIYTSIKLLK